MPEGPEPLRGPSGARALTAFKDMPALTSFHLSLQSTGIGTAGAEALAALKDDWGQPQTSLPLNTIFAAQ